MATTTLPPALQAATDWLKRALQDGPRPVAELAPAAQAENISFYALERASLALGCWKTRGRSTPTWALEPPPASGEVRVCRKCSVEKPIEQFAVASANRGGKPLWSCLPCDSARKRRSEIAQRDPESVEAVEKMVTSAPSPEPAIALRVELARRRDQGEPFPVAWEQALQVVGADADWRRALEQTKGAWRAAYIGVGQPLALAAA